MRDPDAIRGRLVQSFGANPSRPHSSIVSADWFIV
jgi:hypothetical protein